MNFLPNMLTSEENLLIEAINKITYPQTQQEYITKILNLRKNSENNNQYNLKTALEQFSKPKPSTLQDSQYEVSQIKIQIGELKQQSKNFAQRIDKLENTNKNDSPSDEDIHKYSQSNNQVKNEETDSFIQSIT